MTPSSEPAQPSSRELECPICFIRLTTENAVLTRCGHMFTADCLGKLGSTSRCPTCNQPFTRSECVRVYNGVPSNASHLRGQDKRNTLLRKILKSRRRATGQNPSPAIPDSALTSNVHRASVTQRDKDITQNLQSDTCLAVTDCPTKHSDFATFTLRPSSIPSTAQNNVSSAPDTDKAINISKGSGSLTSRVATSHPVKHSGIAQRSYRKSSVSRGTASASTKPALPGTTPPPHRSDVRSTARSRRTGRPRTRKKAKATPETKNPRCPPAPKVHVSAAEFRRISPAFNRRRTEIRAHRARQARRARRQQLALLLVCTVIVFAVGPAVLLEFVRNLIGYLFIRLVILLLLCRLVGF